MTFSKSRKPLSKSRFGVTLLELLIALGVLAVLLLVAWSLFGTLQKAEERSGGLARRVQLLRQARAWLVADMDQLEANRTFIGTGLSTPPAPQFIGDSTGFVASIVPSLNPLPFLQGAFVSSADSEPAELSVFDTDEQRQVHVARESIWPEEKLSVEYRLEPQSQRPTLGASLEESMMFRLVRREFLPSDSPDPSETISNSLNTNKSTAADRQLTIRDLYRQTDEDLEVGNTAMREKELNGLTQASFRYFNGRGWQNEWNSKKEGGHPLAVALQFDYPSRAASRQAIIEASSNEADTTGTDLTAEPDSIDSLLAQQPTATLDTQQTDDFLVATSTAEVTIVVATHSYPSKNMTNPMATAPIERRP